MLSKIAKLYDNLRKGIRPEKKEPDVSPRTVLESKKFSQMYNQINEARLSVNFNTGRTAALELPTDDTAKKVLGYANSLTKDLKTLLTDWAAAGNWSETAQKKIVPTLMEIIGEYYELDNDAVIEKLVSAINFLTKGKESLTSFGSAIASQNNSFFHFLDLTIQKYNDVEIFKNEDVLKRIVGLTFDESGVNVGPGEVLITLFSEAINPKKGDLEVNGEEVEVKALQARLGKKLNDTANALKEISKLLGSGGDLEKDKIINMLSEYVAPSIGPYINQIKQSLPQKLKISQKLYMDIIEGLASENRDAVKKLLDSNDNSKLRIAFTAGSDLLSTLQLLPRNELETFNEYIISNILRYTNIKVTQGSKDLKTYFDVYTGNQAIEMYSKFAPAANRNEIKPIIAEYYGKLNPLQIIISIQGAIYQRDEKFKYIVFINPVINKMLAVGPFDGSFGGALRLFLQNAHNFTGYSLKKTKANPEGEYSESPLAASLGRDKTGFNVSIA